MVHSETNQFEEKLIFGICRNGNGNQKGDANPFEEEEWDEDVNDALIDNGEPGVPVRALYDYEGAESDELSFKQGKYNRAKGMVCYRRRVITGENIFAGELFEKLEDEDEQGWCKGRKEGRVGLYPANYVEPVA